MSHHEYGLECGRANETQAEVSGQGEAGREINAGVLAKAANREADNPHAKPHHPRKCKYTARTMAANENS
jgi:hypothetical protein